MSDEKYHFEIPITNIRIFDSREQITKYKFALTANDVINSAMVYEILRFKTHFGTSENNNQMPCTLQTFKHYLQVCIVEWLKSPDKNTKCEFIFI